MTEYAFLVQTCELPAPGASGQTRAQVIAEKLAALSEPLRLSLNSFDHGGWQVLSHHLLESNGLLIVSFLMSRPKPMDS